MLSVLGQLENIEYIYIYIYIIQISKDDVSMKLWMLLLYSAKSERLLCYQAPFSFDFTYAC